MYYLITAWVVSVSWGCTGLVSPLVSVMCIKYGTRSICVLGGFIAGLGALFTSFSEQLIHVFISWSVIASLGIGLCMVSEINCISVDVQM